MQTGMDKTQLMFITANHTVMTYTMVNLKAYS